jgi:hypothetical protein
MIRMNAVNPAPIAETSAPSGRDAGRAMTSAMERLSAAGDRSTAEMLSELRRQFPNSPLAVRVRALEALRSR